MKEGFSVKQLCAKDCVPFFTECHYARRMPSISAAFGLFKDDFLIGAISFGVPGSRHLQISACPTAPDRVIELNRLFVLDDFGKNLETWFLSRALKLLGAFIVVSYADTAQGHLGYVYRAANFRYAGWTDMDRKTPRFDYVVPGKHSRSAFRGEGEGVRSEKVRYWLITGNAREQKALMKLSAWPSLSWKEYPPPTEHLYLRLP